jgi:hypothetical protein
MQPSPRGGTGPWNALPTSVTNIFAASGMGSILPLTNATPPQEQSLAEELGEMTELSLHQRLIAFVLSIGMGIIFIAIAISLLPTIAIFGKKFAFFYTCGSLFCVGSTGFLVGFQRQMQVMTQSNRAQAAAVYFGCVLLTLVAALVWKSSLISLVAAGAQLVAVLWYALSFIPFARQVIGTVLSSMSFVLRPLLQVVGRVVSTVIGLCFK